MSEKSRFLANLIGSISLLLMAIVISVCSLLVFLTVSFISEFIPVFFKFGVALVAIGFTASIGYLFVIGPIKHGFLNWCITINSYFHKALSFEDIKRKPRKYRRHREYRGSSSFFYDCNHNSSIDDNYSSSADSSNSANDYDHTPPVNINGYPMVGSTDIFGNPYGVDNSRNDYSIDNSTDICGGSTGFDDPFNR